MMPDRIQITHRPRTMSTPDFRALCAELLQAWQLGDDIAGPMNRARLELDKPEGEGPSEKDLYDLAAEFNGDPVPAMRRALEVWGNPPAPEPGPTFQDAIRLAEGCHDYSGGHSGTEGEAWHGAIDTVVAVLKKATDGPWDSQTRAVYGVGSEAQAGEVGELVEWLTMLRDHSKGVASNYDNKLEGLATLLQRQEAELAALRGVPVAELDDQHREAVHQAVAEALGSGAYDCQRVWEAWGVGTMGPDDFVPVAEDSDRVAEIADAAIEAIQAIPQPAPQAGEVEA